ncbi:hypothetical protein FM104_00675 [Microbacterium esteraromaticum]|uniref:Uncharacterized protein n=1 Tax=Microbacterium esteraromaticum TaxID=57043 RepID=A0A1R4I9E2_9MICO|nr:hypothetical protein FM104_00675 [Microbacterium esteraromaticum]
MDRDGNGLNPDRSNTSRIERGPESLPCLTSSRRVAITTATTTSGITVGL